MGDAGFGDYQEAARAGGPTRGFLQKGRENVMKNLLFFTAAALLRVETVAYADPPSQNIIERGGGDERFPPLPPQPQAAVSPGCHNVRVRIGTHNGHPVYRTRRVCG
jgi:hypothetical protein